MGHDLLPAAVTLAGRVVAIPAVDSALLAVASRRVTVRGRVAELAPGDLVRVLAEVWPGEPGTPAVYRAKQIDLVFRPLRDPFGSETETGTMLGGGLGERLRLRAAVLRAVRAYFDAEGFLEVETPAQASSPGLDLHLHAYATHSTTSPSTLPAYLITSPEYHLKRLLAGGLERCFELARCFRADEVGSRHEPEFTMLEWYRSWDGVEAVMKDTEAVLRVASEAGPTPGRLHAYGHAVSLQGEFERLSVREAFARHAPDVGDPIALAAADEDRFFSTLVDLVEPRLGHDRPTFLTRYPASQASLARIAEDDPTVCERFELYVRGIEVCNGFDELTDPVEQRARLEHDQRRRAQRGLPVYPIDERFVRALEEGMPPSAGNALGVDRLIALVAGRDAIADVMAFPLRRR